MTQKHKEREITLRQEQTRSQWRKAKTTPTTRALKTKQNKNSFCVTGGSCHKYNFCRDKTFVFGGHKYACREKHVCFFHDKSFILTKTFCHDKQFCRDKSFVAASVLLSRQKTFFVPTNTCLLRQKMILVAASASDMYTWRKSQHSNCSNSVRRKRRRRANGI